MIARLWVAILLSALVGACNRPAPNEEVIQLNWLHDPTFAGEYHWALSDPSLRLVQGGPNITPLGELAAGRAHVAVVGADIFLQAIARDTASEHDAALVAVFVDLQRNPVGWVLHPDAARRAGLPNTAGLSDTALNGWLFRQFARGTIEPGDKRGTETTAIWVQWRALRRLPDRVKVTPVGFDPSVVLDAPMLAYPVYLNEEPFKLAERIGRPVIVFDPALDGVSLYGNVVVTTRGYIRRHPERIHSLQTGLRSGWQKVRADMPGTAALVARYYKGVSDSTLARQLRRTVEFVTYGGALPGAMDTTDAGRWGSTLRSLQDAGVIASHISMETVKRHLLAPR